MCITVDFDTLETGVVTVRDRDTMEQDHVHVDELVASIQKKIRIKPGYSAEGQMDRFLRFLSFGNCALCACKACICRRSMIK